MHGEESYAGVFFCGDSEGGGGGCVATLLQKGRKGIDS